MSSIGILAYGSLTSDPGTEISPLITRRIVRLSNHIGTQVKAGVAWCR
jgi:hypothetical protein